MKIEVIKFVISCVGIVSAVIGLFFSPDGFICCRAWLLPIICIGMLFFCGFLLVVISLMQCL